ncbi:MAG: peroxiredoxin-like family protein [Methylacidiphilales bacterium]|nr:peroxiredoxin-like family protein [Candidatus Methylacidiphilales bacterium]
MAGGWYRRKFTALFKVVSAVCLLNGFDAVAWGETVPEVTTVPDVLVKTPSDENFRLKRATTGLRSILYFYRGYWCPYGMSQLKELRNSEGVLESLGFQIFAMSPDRPARVQETAADLGAGFVLLSDNKMTAARAFGIAHRVSGTEWQQLKRYGIDLEFISDEAHHELPQPAFYFVGRDGKIQDRFLPERISSRLSGDDVIQRAKRLLDLENISPSGN